MLSTRRVHSLLCLVIVTLQTVLAQDLYLYSDDGVVVKRDVSSQGYDRQKRQVHRDMLGFNIQQKQAILDRHNDLRGKQQASDMLKMAWNYELEKLAQNYSTLCTFKHNKNRHNVVGFQNAGENIFAGTGDFDPAGIVQAWYDEVKDYNYKTLTCKKGAMCGHYTQIVWASTKAVGCGVKYCPVLRDVPGNSFNHGYLVVCNYGPSGNYIGTKPYTMGKACSQCPTEAQFCVRDLCAERPQIGSSVSFAQIPSAENSSPSSHKQLLFPSLVTLLLLYVQIKFLNFLSL